MTSPADPAHPTGTPMPGPGRVAAWLAKQVELALSGVDLSPPQYRVLGVLAEGDSMPSALAERLAVRRPTITAVVDGLVARGLVERAPDAGDRRRVHHAITAEGASVLAAADVAVDERLYAIAARLGSRADAAVAGLELWREALRSLAEGVVRR